VITIGFWSKISNESQWKKLPNLILSVGGSEKWINVNRLMGGIGIEHYITIDVGYNRGIRLEL
jgi:hypothetical protein